MIFFLSTGGNRHPIDIYLASWGRDYRDLIQPLTYSALAGGARLYPGIYVFCDLELLTGSERERAVAIRQELDERDATFAALNDPRTSLGRYDLLRRLYDRGINDFRVFRPDDDLAALRYPVFLRHEHDHRGPRRGRIDGPAELDGALERLPSKDAEAHRWMITEYCDTSDANGIFRKYSAFMVDRHVIPRHLFFSRDWVQKEEDLLDRQLLALESQYVRANPHEDRLREVFGIAGIEYGRIDYGLREGRIQVWEINTNPMLLSFTSARPGPRLPVHQRFAEVLHGVWDEMARTPAGRTRQRDLRQRMLAALHRVRENPDVPGPLRGLARRVTDHLRSRPSR